MSKINKGDICVYDHSGTKKDIKLSDLCIVNDENFHVRFLSTGYTDRVSQRDLRKLDEVSMTILLEKTEDITRNLMASIQFVKNKLSSTETVKDKILHVLSLDISKEDQANMIKDITSNQEDIYIEELPKMFSAVRDFMPADDVLFVLEPDRSRIIDTSNAVAASMPRGRRRSQSILQTGTAHLDEETSTVERLFGSAISNSSEF